MASHDLLLSNMCFPRSLPSHPVGRLGGRDIVEEAGRAKEECSFPLDRLGSVWETEVPFSLECLFHLSGRASIGDRQSSTVKSGDGSREG